MRDGQTFTLNPKGCIPTDVLKVAAMTSANDHYAAFSHELIRPMIEACSEIGDLVLDPFAGSGTTCIVAATLSRQTLGIELNPSYVESGNLKMQDYLKKNCLK